MITPTVFNATKKILESGIELEDYLKANPYLYVDNAEQWKKLRKMHEYYVRLMFSVFTPPEYLEPLIQIQMDKNFTVISKEQEVLGE